MQFPRSFIVLVCSLWLSSSWAAQNIFVNQVEAVPEVEATPEPVSPSSTEASPVVSMPEDSEVVIPENVPVPEPRPVIENDPKKVVFRFNGTDWKRRSARDYGLENRYKMAVRPLWEKNTPEPYKEMGTSYTQYAAFIIDHFGENLINGPNDFTRKNDVCPKYNRLSRAQRIEFWVHFIAAVTKPESGYKPKDRMHEKTQKPDKVTGERTYSEGLLQLSYKDMLTYPKECGGVFNWEHDKNISRTSDNKTIFDPMRNLYCGIGIQNRIVKNRKSVYHDKNPYWSVLMPNGRYGKVPQINAEVRKQTPFCR